MLLIYEIAVSLFLYGFIKKCFRVDDAYVKLHMQLGIAKMAFVAMIAPAIIVFASKYAKWKEMKFWGKILRESRKRKKQ